MILSKLASLNSLICSIPKYIYIYVVVPVDKATHHGRYAQSNLQYGDMLKATYHMVICSKQLTIW